MLYNLFNNAKLSFTRYIILNWSDNGFDVAITVNDDKQRKFNHLLSNTKTILFSQIGNLLTFSKNYVNDNNDISPVASNNGNINFLQLILQQITLSAIPKKQCRYPAETVLLAFKVFSSSQSVYLSLYKSAYLCLPLVRTLCCLTSSMTSEGNIFTRSKYLEHVSNITQDYEKEVCLLINEIVVNLGLQYSAGIVIATAINTKNEQIATSVSGFELSQIKGHRSSSMQKFYRQTIISIY